MYNKILEYFFSENNENKFDFNSFLIYFKNNYIQIFLLLLVPIIIYVVDHISNINTFIYSIPPTMIGAPPFSHKIIKQNKKRSFSKK